MVKFTYIAPQAAYAASVTLYVTDRAVVQPRPQFKPALTNLGPQPYIHTEQPQSAVFNGLHPNYPCKYMHHYSFTDPGGMEG